MNSNFIVEEQDGISTLRLARQLSLEELLQVLDDAVSLDVGNRRIWDATRHFNYTADEVRSIAEHGKVIWPGAARVAYVAEDDLTFGLVRMFEVFREQENYQTKVFRDEQAARTWLLDWEE